MRFLAPHPKTAWFWPGFIIAWVGFILLYAARLDYLPGHLAFWAVVASNGFLLGAWTPGNRRNAFTTFIFLGLVGCWFGDLIGPFHFMTGVYAFFFAQTFFSVAAWCRGIDWKRAMPVIPAMVAVNGGMLWYILPGTPESETIKVISYSVVISIMVITAVGAGKGNAPLVWAAVLFYISDVFVALWRFGDSSASGWICYPIYYLACLLFAYSIHADQNSEMDSYSEAATS